MVNPTLIAYEHSPLYKERHWVSYFLEVLFRISDNREKYNGIDLAAIHESSDKHGLVNLMQDLGSEIDGIRDIDQYPDVKKSLNYWLTRNVARLFAREEETLGITSNGLSLLGCCLSEIVTWNYKIQNKL